MKLAHARFQLDCLTVNHKGAIAAVVEGLRIPLRRIDPGFEHFKNEKIIFVDKAPVGHTAFEIGKAFGDERTAPECHAVGVKASTGIAFNSQQGLSPGAN